MKVELDILGYEVFTGTEDECKQFINMQEQPDRFILVDQYMETCTNTLIIN